MHFRWQTKQFSFAVLYQPCVPLRPSFTPHAPPSSSIVTFFLQLHCPLHPSLHPPFPFASCHHAPTQNLLIHFRRQVTRLKLPAVYGHSFRRRETRVSNYPDVKRSPLPSPLTCPPFVASIGRSVKAGMTSFVIVERCSHVCAACNPRGKLCGMWARHRWLFPYLLSLWRKTKDKIMGYLLWVKASVSFGYFTDHVSGVRINNPNFFSETPRTASIERKQRKRYSKLFDRSVWRCFS